MFIAYFLGKSTITVNIVFLAISVVVCWFMGRKGLKSAGVEEPESGLTLECPACHCPHAWVMTEKEVIVESKEKVTETTTRSGYDEGDIVDYGFRGFRQINGTTEKISFVYRGRSIKDFECLNCGRTEHNTYSESWHRKDENDEPESWHRVYNPPMPAYEHNEAAAKREAAEAKQEADAKELYEQAKKEMGKSR